MRGLLTLHDLSVNKIQEIINYALKLKGGFSKNYVGKKMATLFLRIQREHNIAFKQLCSI